jgi:hypothetical protein
VYDAPHRDDGDRENSTIVKGLRISGNIIGNPNVPDIKNLGNPKTVHTVAEHIDVGKRRATTRRAHLSAKFRRGRSHIAGETSPRCGRRCGVYLPLSKYRR